MVNQKVHVIKYDPENKRNIEGYKNKGNSE